MLGGRGRNVGGVDAITSASTTARIRDLANGTEYVCRAFAANEIGVSHASALSDIVRPCSGLLDCNPAALPIVVGTVSLLSLGILLALFGIYRERSQGYVLAVLDGVHSANIGKRSRLGIEVVRPEGAGKSARSSPIGARRLTSASRCAAAVSSGLPTRPEARTSRRATWSSSSTRSACGTSSCCMRSRRSLPRRSPRGADPDENGSGARPIDITGTPSYGCRRSSARWVRQRIPRVTLADVLRTAGMRWGLRRHDCRPRRSVHAPGRLRVARRRHEHHGRGPSRSAHSRSIFPTTRWLISDAASRRHAGPPGSSSAIGRRASSSRRSGRSQTTGRTSTTSGGWRGG